MKTPEKDITGKVLAVLFILMGLPKILGLQMAVDNFERWQLNDSIRMITGVLEILLGAMMFMPTYKRYAAFGLFCMMPAGAMVHIIADEKLMLFLPVVFGVLLLWYLVKQNVINWNR
jgi:uncharacterized membrane protein YphA (DoxX/SURF4 family)